MAWFKWFFEINVTFHVDLKQLDVFAYSVFSQNSYSNREKWSEIKKRCNAFHSNRAKITQNKISCLFQHIFLYYYFAYLSVLNVPANLSKKFKLLILGFWTSVEFIFT
jgi:hypothetical protein